MVEYDFSSPVWRVFEAVDDMDIRAAEKLEKKIRESYKNTVRLQFDFLERPANLSTAYETASQQGLEQYCTEHINNMLDLEIQAVSGSTVDEIRSRRTSRASTAGFATGLVGGYHLLPLIAVGGVIPLIAAGVIVGSAAGLAAYKTVKEPKEFDEINKVIIKEQDIPTRYAKIDALIDKFPSFGDLNSNEFWDQVNQKVQKAYLHDDRLYKGYVDKYLDGMINGYGGELTLVEPEESAGNLTLADQGRLALVEESS